MESLLAVVDTTSSAYQLGSLAGIIVRSILFGVILGVIANKIFQAKHPVIGDRVRTSAQDKAALTYSTIGVSVGILASLALYFFVGI